MNPTKLAQINADKTAKELQSVRHREALAHTDMVASNVLRATESLIKYLEGHTSKTEVVNQLTSISTPDVDGVVKALEILDTSVQNIPQTDLSGLTALMQEMVNEAKQLPKAFPSPAEFPKPIDNTKQLESLKQAIQAVERVVKAQKLIAEAPVVNVPETNVHVDAPDLKPLQSSIKDVVKAVKAIVIPEYKTDNAGVEKLLTNTNKLLDQILDKPVSGGGGGGSSWTAVGTNDLPAPLNVVASTSVPARKGLVVVNPDGSNISGGGGGGGDATAANQIAGNNTLTSIDTRLTDITNQGVGNSTATNTNVTMTGSSVSVAPSNAARKTLSVYNDTGVVVYLKFGAGASSTSFTIKLASDSYYELPKPAYTGAVHCFGASGVVRVTET